MWMARCPEDFRVDEIPLFPASGVGEHTFVRVEKRLRTTEQVVRELARLAGVRPRDVGYAGRKDRLAVTRQWFSVPGLDPHRLESLAGQGWRALEAARHPHKLRTGQLRANRFELVVRDRSVEQMAAAPARLAALAQRGMPNRFGPQRFGRDRDNARRGLELLRGAKPGRDRRAARFWLSALQAEVFNLWLERRPLALDRLEDGDVAWIHGSGAAFVVRDAQREAERAARFEISPAGPLPGTRLLAPKGAPLERERALLRECGMPDPFVAPRGIRLRGARRPARVRPEGVSVEPVAADAVRLCFRLPPGSYASVLVECVFPGCGKCVTPPPASRTLPESRGDGGPR